MKKMQQDILKWCFCHIKVYIDLFIYLVKEVIHYNKQGLVQTR